MVVVIPHQKGPILSPRLNCCVVSMVIFRPLLSIKLKSSCFTETFVFLAIDTYIVTPWLLTEQGGDGDHQTNHSFCRHDILRWGSRPLLVFNSWSFSLLCCYSSPAKYRDNSLRSEQKIVGFFRLNLCAKLWLNLEACKTNWVTAEGGWIMNS